MQVHFQHLLQRSVRKETLTLTIKISRKYETEQKIYKILAAISDQVMCYRTNRWMMHSCYISVMYKVEDISLTHHELKNRTKESKVQPVSQW